MYKDKLSNLDLQFHHSESFLVLFNLADKILNTDKSDLIELLVYKLKLVCFFIP